MNKFLSSIVLFLTIVNLSAQESAEWIRQSAISPDGSSIAFSYQGDIYLVPANGGEASPITFNMAHDFMPVWSSDGSKIGFASNRYGNFDIFICDVKSAKTERLTYHSNDEFPYCFTVKDDEIVFSGQRMDDYKHRQYPTRYLPETYKVPVNGGQIKQLWTIPAEDVQLSSDGKTMLYHDKKGGENTWRKHHTSSVTRDIWMYKVEDNTHKQISSFKGEDRNPVFADDNATYYYLSEESGNFNVHKANINSSGSERITTFKEHPVRYLSASKNGTLCFTHHGELYTLKGNGPIEKIEVKVKNGFKDNPVRIEPVSGSISEMAVSPDGKEIAYIIRGDVFVSSVEGSITKQITKTAGQERFLSFSSDGKQIIYASERDSLWGIYVSKKHRTEELYFFASTLIDEKKLVENNKDNYQPELSPDGKQLAYIENKTTLKVLQLESGENKILLTPNELYYMRDGDQYFKWSPDSKWLLVEYSPLLNNSEVVLVKADGSGPFINLTQSGYGDYKPVWANGSKQVLWFSDRDGMRSWANSGSRQADIYSMFLNQDAWDRYRLSKDEYILHKEIEKKKEESDKKQKDKKKDSEEVKDSLAVNIEFEGLEERKSRLTIHSSNLADATLSEGGDTLYYIARFEKDLNLWTTDLRTKETKMLIPLEAKSAKLQWDKKMKNLFLLADGKISKVDLKDKKLKPVSIKGEIILDVIAEREQMFEHVYKKVKTMFYTSDYHGVNWDKLAGQYREKLSDISNDVEFAEFLSEMLGELNVSHCGASYRPKNESADETAALGIFFDYGFDEDGLKITEIINDGPLDKANLKVEVGDVITEIDGVPLNQNIDFASLLNRKAGKFTSLKIDKTGSESKLVTVKPITLGEEGDLLYKRWVKQNEEEVKKLGNGRIGYVHIPGMGDGPYRNTYEKVMGKYHDCDALIVDTRFNGGGDLVSDLAAFLTGEKYIEYAIEKRPVGYEPTFRWTKPSLAMVNEANYSDGHCFACGYQNLGIGKMLGMPVPGTCSFAGWETLQNGVINWGTVPVSAKNAKGEWLENLETIPDIVIKNMPGKIDAGIDQQLESAIKEMIDGIK